MLSSHKKLRIIVGGMVGQYPLGGVAWDYFHYVLALHELGHEVYYHEDTFVWPHHPVKGYPTDDANYSVEFLQNFFEKYAPEELRHRWHYVLLREKHFGMTREQFDEVARTADLFLNVSGACFIPDIINPRCVKVLMDTDPGYNQIVMSEKPDWAKGATETWHLYDRHLTYAENIYAEDCIIPRLGFDWITTRCVVTLPSWELARHTPPAIDAPWTSVMSWGYFGGPLVYRGVYYEAKVKEFEKFEMLPARVTIPLTMAINSWKAPVADLEQKGWKIVNGVETSATPELYWDFIARSKGEWSIAKNVYVDTRSGWFSCRTACYLAAGRPAVVQDTAWSRYIPSGKGVIAFTTFEECVRAMEEMSAHYAEHAAAAYEIAREYLAPDKVLPPMLDAIFSASKSVKA